MVSRDVAFGILISAAVGTLHLVPAQGSAQDSSAVSCADVYFMAPLEDLLRCAQQGYADAQYNLGRMYGTGQGVIQDDAEAVRWYLLAAEQGVADAQLNLGAMHGNGEGVPESNEEAVHWYRLAAEQGNAIAQSNLGLKYANGEGVPRDLVLAHLWYNLSAAQGDVFGRTSRGIIERRMTPEQIAEAQRLSREWIETHPQGGSN